MAQQEMACSACGSRFPSQAACPDCGVPTSIASAEERVLWEMGQWDSAAAADPPAALRLTSVTAREAEPAAVAGPSAQASTERTKPKPFSPVPLPRRRDLPDPPATRSGSVPRPAAAPARRPEPAVGSPAPAAPVPERTAPERTAQEPPSPPPVARGSIVRRAGESRAPDPEPAPVAEVTYRSAKRETKRRERYQRKIDRLMERLGAADGEVVMNSLDGTLGIRPATLVLTNYRIAVVPHRKRWPSRWIPLEEVTKISGRTGSSMLIVDASVEVLRFGARRANRLHELAEQLRTEVKEARTGRSAGRHNAMLVQMWCDRTSQIWDSPWGRVRLWLDHHPRMRLFMFSPLIPLGFLVAQSVRF